jgi:hypothetical protein
VAAEAGLRLRDRRLQEALVSQARPSAEELELARVQLDDGLLARMANLAILSACGFQ